MARREFGYRVKTRAYRWSTIILVIAGVALALTPTILAFLDRDSTGDRIEVVVGDSDPQVDVVLALGSILNAAGPTDSGTRPGRPAAALRRRGGAGHRHGPRGHRRRQRRRGPRASADPRTAT